MTPPRPDRAAAPRCLPLRALSAGLRRKRRALSGVAFSLGVRFRDRAAGRSSGCLSGGRAGGRASGTAFPPCPETARARAPAWLSERRLSCASGTAPAVADVALAGTAFRLRCACVVSGARCGTERATARSAQRTALEGARKKGVRGREGPSGRERKGGGVGREAEAGGGGRREVGERGEKGRGVRVGMGCGGWGLGVVLGIRVWDFRGRDGVGDSEVAGNASRRGRAPGSDPAPAEGRGEGGEGRGGGIPPPRGGCRGGKGGVGECEAGVGSLHPSWPQLRGACPGVEKVGCLGHPEWAVAVAFGSRCR